MQNIVHVFTGQTFVNIKSNATIVPLQDNESDLKLTKCILAYTLHFTQCDMFAAVL